MSGGAHNIMSDFRLITEEEAPAVERAALLDFERLLAEVLARPLSPWEATKWWPLAAKPPAPNTEDPARTVFERSRWVSELFR